jgi:hypothetical protein
LDTVTWLKFSRDRVMPPWMLEAPAKAAWPPPLAAKGHCVRRDSRTSAETAEGVVGLKMQ